MDRKRGRDKATVEVGTAPSRLAHSNLRKFNQIHSNNTKVDSREEMPIESRHGCFVATNEEMQMATVRSNSGLNAASPS